MRKLFNERQAENINAIQRNGFNDQGDGKGKWFNNTNIHELKESLTNKLE